MIAIQNPSALAKGGAHRRRLLRHSQQVQRHRRTFTVSGFGGTLPVSIQNMPEEQRGAVYGSGDGSLTLINYQKERTTGAVNGLTGTSPASSSRATRSTSSPPTRLPTVLTIVNQSDGSICCLRSPRHLSRQRQPRRLRCARLCSELQLHLLPPPAHRCADDRLLRRPPSWPKAAVDCEPQNGPKWCLFQAQSPDNVDGTGNPLRRAARLRPALKAVFSADGGTAYVLNCGPGMRRYRLLGRPCPSRPSSSPSASNPAFCPPRPPQRHHHSHSRRRQQRAHRYLNHVRRRSAVAARMASSPATSPS